MGSWTETCALSNMPIVDDEEVVYLILTENPRRLNKGFGPGTYSDDFFSVRNIPLYGTYRDYGEVGPNDGEEGIVKLLIEQFKDDLIDDIDVRYCNSQSRVLDLENLQDWFHGGQVRVKSDYFVREGIDQIRLCKIMIKRSVWDAYVNLGTCHYKKAFENIRARVINIVETNDKKILKTYHETGIMRCMFEHPIDLMIEYENFYSALNSIQKPFINGLHKATKLATEMFVSGELDEKAYSSIYDRLIEYYCIHNAMYGLRQAWLPTIGAGSQSAEFELFAKKYDLLSKIVAEDLKRYDEW